VPLIQLPIQWVSPGPVRNDVVTVTYDETQVVDGYHTRQITDIVWPADFPAELKASYEKPIYHSLNKERQKVVI
jgi:hypothetical protein